MDPNGAGETGSNDQTEPQVPLSKIIKRQKDHPGKTTTSKLSDWSPILGFGKVAGGP